MQQLIGACLDEMMPAGRLGPYQSGIVGSEACDADFRGGSDRNHSKKLAFGNYVTLGDHPLRIRRNCRPREVGLVGKYG